MKSEQEIKVRIDIMVKDMINEEDLELMLLIKSKIQMLQWVLE